MSDFPERNWFWAKLGQAEWPMTYHPVVCHLIDVGCVARELWDKAVRRLVKERVAAQLQLSEEHAGAWIAFWIAAHDIGKVTPCFQLQGKTDELKKRLASNRYETAVGDKPHHTYTGTQVFFDAIRSAEHWPKVDDALANSVAVATGGHHGTFPVDWRNRCVNELKGDKWIASRTAILADLARRFGVVKLNPPTLKKNPDDQLDQSVWMFLAGLTSVADWIGSNVTFFPPHVGEGCPFDAPLDTADYFQGTGRRATEALTALGWLNREAPTETPRSFADVTGIAKPRPLQEEIVRISENMTSPQLVIVEAPMGEGKTEAAWYVADCWDRRGGAGTYVALPTMATSNQMFDRVQAFLAASQGKSNLMLQHGKASLNENFEILQFAARVYDADNPKSASGVVAEEWFAKNKKHGLLAPFGVGTIDQVLLAVLQTKHVFVRLFGLAGKCVILDEVHAYDAYMTTLMERLLRWLAALGCPVVLLSATLPKEKRARLIDAYAGCKLPEPEHKDYPRVTTVAVGDPHADVRGIPAADPPRKSTVHLHWLKEGELVEKLQLALKHGGCAAVIRNTVGLAQATYTELKAAFAGTDTEVELFHARFPFGRRDQIEKNVLKRYGKTKQDVTDDKGRIVTAPNRPAKAILVATQVIEQSLDLDFDVMVSDVAPVDLVLQRAGRLHRHNRERPAALGVPNLWLIEPGDKDGRPDFGHSEAIYARFVLLRSFIALKGKSRVELPGDLEQLVEQIYGNEPLGVRKEDVDDLAASEHDMRIALEDSTLNAMGVSIDSPNEDPLHEQNALLQEDDPEAHERIKAATRETEPTVQLVLVYRLDGSEFLAPDRKEPFFEDRIPTSAQLRRLLENEVSIGNTGCVFHYVRQPVPIGWRKSGMLRFHRVVRLDANGQSVAGEYDLKYDLELGIYFAQKQ